MPTNNNPISTISYTNKDFRSIVEELIDLTKKLTEKWDPSITNESDPAMVLLKLDALIGDKNNYNIDKNILEAFPETLTQDVSARSMYSQLAYHMPWYQAATTSVICRWKGRDLLPDEYVVIPKYTMICNSDSSIIYTMMTDVTFNMNQLSQNVVVKQGIITDLTINGEKDIVLTNLDNNNRIYIGVNNVAENGIFITNKDQDTYWEQKPNLQIEHEGNTFYEFGIDVRSGRPYLEFPEDIETLIKTGLNIKYLLCDGENGNLSATELTKFYEDVSVPINNSVDNDTILLNEDSIEMFNSEASTDGANPQSIRDAFKSWKRTAGTYDTLVTLRDYINAIYNTGLVSNDLVSDRLTDIQTAYKIMTDRASYSTSIIKMDEEEMTAYDLKLYLLHNPGIVATIDSYEQSFEMESDSSKVKVDVLNSIENDKCIVHDFVDLKPDIPCLFRNVYPLRIKIVPQNYLSETQVDELKRNIVSDLFKVLNAHQMEFGKEPDYYLIYDTIVNADERIKLVVLDDFTYTTYATYWAWKDEKRNIGEFKHIPVSEFNDPYILTGTMDELKNKAKTLTNPQRFLFIDTSDSGNGTPKNTVYKYDAQKKEISEEIYSDKINEFRRQILAKNILAGVTPLYKQVNTFKYTIDQNEVSQNSDDTQRVTTHLDISPFGFEDPLPSIPKYSGNNTATYELKENETLQFLAPSFRATDQYSSNVYYEFIMQNPTKKDDEPVAADYRLYDRDANTYNGIKIASSAADTKDTITLYYYDETKSFAWTPAYGDLRTLQVKIGTKTESFADAFDKNELAVFILKQVRRVSANESYRLQDGDLIAFFWRESTESDSPYSYRVYRGQSDSEKNIIIKPTFTLNAVSYEERKITVVDWYPSNATDFSGTAPVTSSLYNIIVNFASYPDNYLTASKQISIQAINQVEYAESTMGYYFLTNDIRHDNTNNIDYCAMKFKHFENTDYYEYILGVDEYFITVNSSSTVFEVLSYGTMIRLYPTDEIGYKFKDEYELLVRSIGYNELALNGTSAFYDYALFPDNNTKYPSEFKVLVREQQIYNFAGGDTILITLDDSWKIGDELPHFETGVWKIITNFSIKYKTAGSIGFEDLPKIAVSVNDDENWRGTALLNIDASNTDAQVIDNSLENGDSAGTSRQSIQQFIVNDVKYPSDDEFKNYLLSSVLFLLTEIPITKVGGNNVDITFLNEYGETKNVDIYIYNLNPAFTTDGFDRIGDNILLDVDGNSHEVENIELQFGYKYILGIVNPAVDAKFKIKGYAKDGTDFPIICLTEPEQTEFGNGAWYFSIDQQNINTDAKRFSAFTITFTKEEKDSAMIFEELIKCQDNNFYDDIDQKKNYGIKMEDLLNTISSLDLKDNIHLFKYNYTVDPSILIEDPLKAKTFFNENQVFNKYTIGMAQMRMSGYNENDSNIILINNTK